MDRCVADNATLYVQFFQPLNRAYGDNVVMGDGYYQLALTDKSGKVHVFPARYSATWIKLDGRWQIVNQHNAPVRR